MRGKIHLGANVSRNTVRRTSDFTEFSAYEIGGKWLIRVAVGQRRIGLWNGKWRHL
jgi:hypothetical protein